MLALRVTGYTGKDSGYIRNQVNLTPEHPILVDKYLVGKEVEVDAICDAVKAVI